MAKHEGKHVYDWHGKTVEVTTRPLWKHLGLTISIDVLVDGKRALATGGKFKLKDTDAAYFEVDGRKHKMTLDWRVSTDTSYLYTNIQPIGYALMIDDRHIGQATIYHSTLKSKMMATVVIVGGVLIYMLVAIVFLTAHK